MSETNDKFGDEFVAANGLKSFMNDSFGGKLNGLKVSDDCCGLCHPNVEAAEFEAVGSGGCAAKFDGLGHPKRLLPMGFNGAIEAFDVFGQPNESGIDANGCCAVKFDAELDHPCVQS